jgi:hypothetical protein
MNKAKNFYTPDYTIKSKSKKDSTEFLKSRLEQLKVEGREKSREGMSILAMLKIQ